MLPELRDGSFDFYDKQHTDDHIWYCGKKQKKKKGWKKEV